jgi:hypothetical protein
VISRVKVELKSIRIMDSSGRNMFRSLLSRTYLLMHGLTVGFVSWVCIHDSNPLELKFPPLYWLLEVRMYSSVHQMSAACSYYAGTYMISHYFCIFPAYIHYILV